MTRELEDWAKFLAEEEKLSRKRCNIINDPRKSLLPKNSSEYEACRKNFNKLAKLKYNPE